ncbi:MAG TPA: c-type cytochrome, partial [Planctomycetes bacterium]|nr:c-type cytochrome [Planctomycetota bacterium]
DSVFLLLDADGDGVAESRKEFATGFNNIQALAWHGRDLWVANAPDLTLVRDLDGDDLADEYVRIYTDLGNIEHGLHGLNWGPDGRLYMSKGNSKGLSIPGRIAPKPFRDLWGMDAPPGSPDHPTPQRFSAESYRPAYHNPNDDWGREGGVLRCDDMGRNLEIVARGFRNPWDITFDDQFNWLGTDNDQNEGDRIITPFFGAHFGWSHSWSSSWTGENNAPTAPINGPVFQGSGTGIVFYDEPQFPVDYRGVFFINDWLQKTMLVYRPTWNGALMRPEGEKLETFIRGGDALFRPTDLEVGPDGALYCLGWGRSYGVVWDDGEMANEGRVFRIRAQNAAAVFDPLPRNTPNTDWSFDELLLDLDSSIPARRVNAQDEIVRRGHSAKPDLVNALTNRARLTDRQLTWAGWALGRIDTDDESIDEFFSSQSVGDKQSIDQRLQAIRILAYRAARSKRNDPLVILAALLLENEDPRIRFETIKGMWQAGCQNTPILLLPLLAKETDRLSFYVAWRALADLLSPSALKLLLGDRRVGVRRAALLALLDTNALKQTEVEAMTTDEDETVKDIANLWIQKTSSGVSQSIVKGRPLVMDSIELLADSTDLAAVATALKKANREAGEKLFFQPSGVGCFNCHRVGSRGANIGPDLSTIGDRTNAEHIIQSILSPNAVITEGYRQHTVETNSGDFYGALLEETDYLLTLSQADGEKVRIAKKDIILHRTEAGSVMPSYAQVLSPQQVADITVWLLGQRSDSADSPGSKGGLTWRLESDRLIIENSGKPVTDFVFRDEAILRPYFSSVHTQDGIQVTRNHPPVEGTDRTDHSSMHPGIWIAFGDINGRDFWRNKATIRHNRFLGNPRVVDNGLVFATESNLIADGGAPMAQLESRINLSIVTNGYLLSWDARFRALDRDIVFGDQEEMGFGIRVATPLTEIKGGTIRAENGLTSAGQTWGGIFDWCDYSGEVDGRRIGIAVMTHPGNFRASWFHNRNYGLMLANPFGRNAFTKAEKSSVTVGTGNSLRLRWAAFIHSSALDSQPGIEAVYRNYAEDAR